MRLTIRPTITPNSKKKHKKLTLGPDDGEDKNLRNIGKLFTTLDGATAQMTAIYKNIPTRSSVNADKDCKLLVGNGTGLKISFIHINLACHSTKTL